MSSYSDYANAASDIITHKGDALARAKSQNGQLIGSTIATLGSQIPQQVQDAIAKRAEQRKQQQIQQIFAEAGSDLHAAIPKLRAIDPEMSLKFEKELGAADEVTARAAELKQKHEGEQRDLYLGVLGSANDESQWASGLLGLKNAGVDVTGFSPHFSPEAKAQANRILMTPQQRYAEDKPKAPEDFTLSEGQIRFKADGTQLANVAKPPATLTPDQIADNERADKQLEISRGQLSVAQQRAAQATHAAGSQASDITSLTAGGLDMAALNYRKTGIMPPLGMGDRTTRQRILNRAAELTATDIQRIEAGGTDVAGNKADYKADSTSLGKLQQQRDAIGAFENTAKKNIDLFLDAAKKIPDTGIPLLNTPARWIAGAGGSADIAKYNAARQVAISEIAKIVQNPNLTGQLSDSARHEIDVFNPSNATLKQTIAVMNLLKQDMANRKTSLDDQLKETRGRIGATGTNSEPAKPVTGRIGPYTYEVVKP